MVCAASSFNSKLLFNTVKKIDPEFSSTNTKDIENIVFL